MTDEELELRVRAQHVRDVLGELTGVADLAGQINEAEELIVERLDLVLEGQEKILEGQEKIMRALKISG